MKKLILAGAVALTVCASFAAADNAQKDAEELSKQGLKTAVGVPGGTSAFFSSKGEGGIHGMCKVTSNAPCERPVDLFSTVIMKYRFTYLGKVVSKSEYYDRWKRAYMVPLNNDTMVTYDELDIPDYPCDMEFYFEGTRKVAYYQYVDYTGLNIGVPGYTEEPPLLATNHIHITSKDRLPSLGKEWFIRLREGKSDIHGVKIIDQR